MGLGAEGIELSSNSHEKPQNPKQEGAESGALRAAIHRIIEQLPDDALRGLLATIKAGIRNKNDSPVADSGKAE